MTLDELYSINDIDGEIKDISRKIAELRERGDNTAANLSGMPRGSGTGDKVGNAATEITYYTEFLEEAKARKIARSHEIHAYIESVEYAQMRRIMFLRFIERWQWKDIAAEIGGNNTEDSVRKRCHRYVRKRLGLSDMSAAKGV